MEPEEFKTNSTYVKHLVMHLKMLIKVNFANFDKSIKFLVNKYNHLNFKIFYP